MIISLKKKNNSIFSWPDLSPYNILSLLFNKYSEASRPGNFIYIPLEQKYN